MVERKDYLFETFRKGSRMAGNGQKKEQQKRDRIVPGVQTGKSSRVSKAAGGIGSSSMRNEQRFSSPAPRSRAGGRVEGQRVSRKGPAAPPPARRGATLRPPPLPADSRLIGQVRERWSRMQPHEHQRIFSVALFLLACFLTCGLTIWRALPLFRPLADFFFRLFTWAAIPLSLGLVAFAIAHLIEGVRNIRVIRWSLVLGLLVLVLLLLAESQLLLGGLAGGAVGGLLATAIEGWGFGAHVLVLGLLLMTVLLTFKITVSQLLRGWGLVQRIFLDPRAPLAQIPSRPVSPFLGERPRFSRYGSPAQEKLSGRSAQRPRPVAVDDPDEEEEELDVEVELEERADHTNDINRHIDQVGRVPKGPRPAQKLDRVEQRTALRGARQQQLPFQGNPGELEEMEPLAPNPLHPLRPQVLRRAAASRGVSPWKPPEGTLFNNPQDLKQQLLGDDVSGLAKTIQDTLRSFRVDAEVRPEDISIGPTVIRFGIRPTGKPLMKEDERGRLAPVKDAAGNVVYEVRTRVSRIMALQNDLALVLESKTIRMEAPVPGRPYIGVEIPNKHSRLVTLREVLESKEYQTARARSKLTVALGKDVAGAVRVGDLGKMPHLLIAGATGAGKCLAYDEPVFLADGRVLRVQALIGTCVNVIGLRDMQTMQQTPVPATFADNGVQDVFEITLADGLTLRRTGEHPLWAALPDIAPGARTAQAGWVSSRELRASPAGHVVLCPLFPGRTGPSVVQNGCMNEPDAVILQAAGAGQAPEGTRKQAAGSFLPERSMPVSPPGYQWREVVSVRQITAPTVSITVHSANHAFVGYAVEHNSVMINTIISSIISQSTPDDVRLLMIDPKMVELTMYNGIPHLLSPVVTEVERVVGLLKIAITEMEKRYRLFSQLGVRNLDGYRKLWVEHSARGDESLKNLPAIVIIIDELADLMMAAPEEVEGLICRLAQLARATGIHLVVATQRPSVDVITGLIKANIPTRISFMVSSAVDSRTIIDMGGAERLLGRGDMLYLPADAGKPERIQGAFVADEEADRLVRYWHQQAVQHAAGSEQAQSSAPGVEPGWEVSERSSDEFELEDDLLEQAEQVVQEYERASISLLQRRLKIGYARAARLIDLLEERGVISRAEPGGRAREILEPRGSARSHGGQGRTLADEAADIMEEERQRQEAVKRQAERDRAKQDGQQSAEA
jgi:DNA segregation ATPase FtsK/SpoIIIE-like protein